MIPIELHINKSFYAGYLQTKFSSEKHPQQIVVDSKSGLGQYIQSHVIVSLDKPMPSWGENKITIYLPQTHRISNKFVFFDKANTNLINQQINSSFNIDFEHFCLTAKQAGLPIKESINMFIELMNLDTEDGDMFERLKKKDYRRRKKMDSLMKKLMNIDIDNN